MLRKKEELEDAALSDFKVTHLLGVGAFGRVFLAELPATGKKYAIKTIRKDKLVDKRDSIKSVMIEFQVLLAANNPFLCNMDYFFMTTERMYFCMDFISGGSIQKVLKVQEAFPEERIKFYAMQMIIGLGILHKNNIMHRDIKPDNLMIDEFGYLKVIDFGLARVL